MSNPKPRGDFIIVGNRCIIPKPRRLNYCKIRMEKIIPEWKETNTRVP
jgi:hypothetical protein